MPAKALNLKLSRHPGAGSRVSALYLRALYQIAVAAVTCVPHGVVMFSKFVGLLRTFGGRITVGKDNNGNIYYRKLENVGDVAEKRWVEFKGSPDTKTIPVEWNSWLSGTRKEAPSPEEIAKLEAQRRNVKVQAALLRKEEEKRRFRAKASLHGHHAEGSPEDMEIIMRQIGSDQTGKGKAEEPSHARYTKVRDPKESAEPIHWQPPGKTTRGTSGTSNASKDSSADGSAEPHGVGEKFQPGTWKP